MKISKEEKKKEAIKRMRQLKLLPSIIEEFQNNDVLYYSEGMVILYWITNKPEWETYVKKFETKYNALVYHAQFSQTEFGDCLSLFYISNYKEEWESDIEILKDGYPFVFVWNIHDESCSEFGNIGIKPSFGGIMRTA